MEMNRPLRLILILLAAIAVLATSCSSESEPGVASQAQIAQQPTEERPDDPAPTAEPAIETPTAVPIADESANDAAAVVTRAVANRIYDPINPVSVEPIRQLGASGDIEQAWIVADALRFVGRGPELEALITAAQDLTGLQLEPTTAWLSLNNHLLAEDIPAPPGYRALKAEIFEAVDVTWTHLFNDDDVTLDWREVTFGGVLADRRSFGSDESCLCIPSLDEPPAVAIDQADWFPDNELVFGIVVDDVARAYPRNILATHEMVNDVIADRRIAIPYCTLCGSARAYFMDDLPDQFDQAVLRTSGLLRRSNKISFDLQTLSMVDTFTGRAISGPWLDAGVELTPITLLITTWGDWQAAHPNTTLMAGKDGDGAKYPLELVEPFADTGLAFPVGAINDSLFPQTPVLGVIGPDGSPVAFESTAAKAALTAGESVEFQGITLQLDGGGLRAFDARGQELDAHEAAWFAWSQFHPTTELWR